MKILLLTQVLPYPPDSGPKVKTWNVIKYLSRNHEVTLVSFVRGDQRAEIEQLKKYCVAVHTVPMKRGVMRDLRALTESLLSGQPWILVRDRRKAMFDQIERLTRETKFDFVHADQLNMAQYAEQVPGVRKVLDAHNALWLLYRRLVEKLGMGAEKLIYSRDWRLLKRYEGRICQEFDALLAVSDEDRGALEEAAGPLKNLVVTPITVDCDEVEVVQRHADADHILHIGTMFWAPNVDGILWFAREIYPLIQANRPDVMFDVVGARPPAEVQALSQEDASIHVTGYVTDPAEYLRMAGVMIVPLRAGGGMRVKILNAMAQGLPIVTTTLGCEGISVEPGRDVLIADTPADFAQAVLSLLSQPELAQKLGENGRKLIETTYDYRSACRPMDQIYSLQDPALVERKA